MVDNKIIDDEWVKMSIPCWQRILKESIESGNKDRENFAKYMLEIILKEDYKNNV